MEGDLKVLGIECGVTSRLSAMPNKHNTDRRHPIRKMTHRVTNWTEYEAGLRSRGSLTLWITPDALEQWVAAPRTTRGGRAQYSDVAIESTLMLGCAFKLRLRQTEGLMGSVLALMGLTLPVPHHTTRSRRAKKRPVVRPACLPAGPLDVLIGQHGVESVWRRAMASGKTRREVTSGLAQAASGGGFRERHDCGAHAHGAGRR